MSSNNDGLAVGGLNNGLSGNTMSEEQRQINLLEIESRLSGGGHLSHPDHYSIGLNALEKKKI